MVHLTGGWDMRTVRDGLGNQQGYEAGEATPAMQSILIPFHSVEVILTQFYMAPVSITCSPWPKTSLWRPLK